MCSVWHSFLIFETVDNLRRKGQGQLDTTLQRFQWPFTASEKGRKSTYCENNCISTTCTVNIENCDIKKTQSCHCWIFAHSHWWKYKTCPLLTTLRDIASIQSTHSLLCQKYTLDCMQELLPPSVCNLLISKRRKGHASCLNFLFSTLSV